MPYLPFTSPRNIIRLQPPLHAKLRLLIQNVGGTGVSSMKCVTFIKINLNVCLSRRWPKNILLKLFKEMPYDRPQNNSPTPMLCRSLSKSEDNWKETNVQMLVSATVHICCWKAPSQSQTPDHLRANVRKHTVETTSAKGLLQPWLQTVLTLRFLKRI